MPETKARRRGARALCLIIIAVLLVASCFGLAIAAARTYYPTDYIEQTSRFADENGLDVDLIMAVIHTESRFDASAISSKGAIGLMQITPDTLDWTAYIYGEHSPGAAALYDPETNVRYGCMLLSAHLNEFGSVRTALAAYNAGRGSVLEWLSEKSVSSDGETLDRIPYPETEQYVRRVMSAQRIYQILYNLEELK